MTSDRSGQIMMQQSGAHVRYAVYKFHSVQGWKCPIEPTQSQLGIIANNHIWVMLKNKYWTRTTPWIKAELEISPLADFHTTPAMSTVACAEPQNSKHSPGFQREMLRKGKGCNFLRSILNGTAWNGTSSASSTSTKSQNRLKSIIACVAGHILVRKSLQPLALFEPKKTTDLSLLFRLPGGAPGGAVLQLTPLCPSATSF